MKIDVLDGGFVRLVEAWGHGEAGRPKEYKYGESFADDADNEVGIIEAARQSTQGAFRGWAEDAKLLAFLFNNRHATPFEFAGMVIEVKAPIFVFREWHRHRTQSYNEMSARYAPMPNNHYLPSIDRCVTADPKNKQAGKIKDAPECDEWSAIAWLKELEALYEQSERVYADGLARGVPKEIARLTVTVARYSQMRASANLRNWLAFVTLRSDPKAQQEIRVYSDAVGTIIASLFPQTWKLFAEKK